MATTTTTRRSFVRLAGVAGAGTLLGFPATASWAAKGSSTGPLRLVFFTDSHVLPDWGAPDAMELTARAINASRPELVIGGGDLIYDSFELPAGRSKAQWDLYMDFHRSLKGPVEVIVGNHDLESVRPNDGSAAADDPRSVFRSRLGLDRTWRRVDAGGTAIFLLDSVGLPDDEIGFKGEVATEQLEWIATELDGTDTDTPIVVVTHIPLLSSIPQAVKGATTPVPPYYLVENNREVLSLFAEHNLVLVLQGHLHAEEMLRWKGTTFITCGAVCGDKWRGPKYGTPEGFGVLTLRADRVDWEYRTIGWEARRSS